MKTLRLHSETEAGKYLRNGKTVAFPTETVFGLGANALDPTAVKSIFAAKGRPADNPLIVHLADKSLWHLAASELPESARVLMDAFSPGPLTLVLPKHPSIHSLVTASLETVAIRIPACRSARKILYEAQVPIAAPSANRSGRPSCTTWQSVIEDLDDRIDAVLCKNSKAVGLESTVVDCCQASPVLLRPGAITLEAIQSFFPNATAVDSSTLSTQDAIASPGLRHAHYQPRAEIRLFESEEQLERLIATSEVSAGYCMVSNRPLGGKLVFEQHFQSVEEYAAEFYEFLREADRKGIQRIFVQLCNNEGLGRALRDRQLRAAGKF